MKKMEQPKEVNESTIDYIIDNAVELTHKEKGGRYNACNRVLSKILILVDGMKLFFMLIIMVNLLLEKKKTSLNSLQ